MSRKIITTVVLAICFATLVAGKHVQRLTKWTPDDPDVSLEELQQDDLKKKAETEGESISKRFDPGTIIAAASLTLSVLNTVLDLIGSVSRKVAVGIANETPYKWRGVGVYFRSGTSDNVLPREVNPGQAVLFGARKTAGTATGVVGVLCYYIIERKSICVLFSVPYDYNWYSNYWDVKVFYGHKKPDQQLYEYMYYGNPYLGDNFYHYNKALSYGFKMKSGIMSSSGGATLKLVIK